MPGLIWAITLFALCTAARVASMLVPREQKPWESGGLTLMKTTSSGRTAPEEMRDVGEEDRHVVCAALIHGIPRVGTDEESPVSHMPGQGRVQVRAGSVKVQPDGGDAAQLGCARRQRREQGGRRRCSAVDEDGVAVVYRGYGHLGADELHAESLARLVPHRTVRLAHSRHDERTFGHGISFERTVPPCSQFTGTVIKTTPTSGSGGTDDDDE
jgi:hypothetical protein